MSPSQAWRLQQLYTFIKDKCTCPSLLQFATKAFFEKGYLLYPDADKRYAFEINIFETITAINLINDKDLLCYCKKETAWVYIDIEYRAAVILQADDGVFEYKQNIQVQDQSLQQIEFLVKLMPRVFAEDPPEKETWTNYCTVKLRANKLQLMMGISIPDNVVHDLACYLMTRDVTGIMMRGESWIQQISATTNFRND